LTEYDTKYSHFSTSVEKRSLLDRIYLHGTARKSEVAIECGARSVTYGTLSEYLSDRSDALSEFVKQGVFVAIERRRSFEFVMDFLTVLALGGIPVPIDLDLPEQRRERLLDLIRPGVLLAESDAILCDQGPGTPDFTSAAIDDGAYVFFTSGSTGLPKPVLGSATALKFFLDWQCTEFGIESGDRIAFLTALSFDVAVRDIFLPLWAGATLVIPGAQEADSPEGTVAWLEHKDISVVNVVPSVARSWLRHGRTRCEAMRKVFFAGEPLTASLLEEWHTMFPETRVRANFYGTTETTLPKVFKRLRRTEELTGHLPAGRPVPEARYCLIEPRRPLEADLVRSALENPKAEGEIVLVSRYVGHGYVGMPTETAKRFVDLGGGVTAYRTGDLGRVDSSGELIVAGRTDDEMKINGVRIHPAEVATAIRSHGSVSEVFVTSNQSGGPRLTAYVVPVEGQHLDTTELRHRLLATVPQAMVPTRLVELAVLPTLPNGKVDRAALQELGEDHPPAKTFIAPSGEIECWLAEQWTGLFGTGAVSATDDFLALGGDSISAMQLASRIRRDLGATLSVRAIFARATVTAIAHEIADQHFLSMDSDELLAMLEHVENVTMPSGIARAHTGEDPV
jgi:amino acid adenylation domain-containing protein